MKDTLSRVLAAIALVVAIGTLIVAAVAWGLFDRRMNTLEAPSIPQVEEEPQDARPVMPQFYQGTLPPNTDPANTTVEYRNAEIGLAFDVPYNPAWGNSEYRLEPYDEFTYLDEEFSPNADGVSFGAGGPWEGGGWAREYVLLARPALSPEETIEDIRQTHEGFMEEPAPEIYKVGSKVVVVYYTGGLCSYVRVTIIGQKANYDLSPLCGNDETVRTRLFEIIRTMEFID